MFDKFLLTIAEINTIVLNITWRKTAFESEAERFGLLSPSVPTHAALA